METKGNEHIITENGCIFHPMSCRIHRCKIIGAVARQTSGHSSGAQRFYDRAKAFVTMAKNGAKSSKSSPPVKGPPVGSWTKRDPYETRFKKTKEAGGPFKGVKREV